MRYEEAVRSLLERDRVADVESPARKRAGRVRGPAGMIQVVWEFVVKPDAVEAFEQAYGPGGVWTGLFSRYPGFHGTTLLRDVSTPRRYLTVDSWETRRHRDDMLAHSEAEYSRLDTSCAGWMESEAEVGIFDVAPSRSTRGRGA